MNNRPYAKETKAWKELESLALMDDYQDIELLFSKYPSRGSDFSLNFISTESIKNTRKRQISTSPNYNNYRK